MKYKMLTLLLALGFLMSPAWSQEAYSTEGKKSWEIISWASPTGDMAPYFSTLYGLKAFIAFMKERGGSQYRTIELSTLEIDDSKKNFLFNLDTLFMEVKPQLIVGGACHPHAKEIADYFRRFSIPWFGPWSDAPELFNGSDTDPIALLPSEPAQFELLLAYAKQYSPEGREVYLIVESGAPSDASAALARAKARSLDIDLKVVTLAPDFRLQANMENLIPNAGTVILWLSQGKAAAFRRYLDKSTAYDTIWMSGAILPPSRELIRLSGGTWVGTVFPAILHPSEEIPLAHKTVLEKYSQPGLSHNYLTYLGFAQGQLMAKALAQVAKDDITSANEIALRLKEMDFSGTIKSGTKLPFGPNDYTSSYLAVVGMDGTWYPAEF